MLLCSNMKNTLNIFIFIAFISMLIKKIIKKFEKNLENIKYYISFNVIQINIYNNKILIIYIKNIIKY